jgi:LuxR family transcriptional regulator, maltose regulon positive regulatory protein
MGRASVRRDPAFAGRARSMLDRESVPDKPVLMVRETEVLRCIARGLPSEEIASELVLSVGTVKRHVHYIYSRLGVRNRTQAVAQPRALGLL